MCATKPEECLMCSGPRDSNATGMRGTVKFPVLCDWCELGTQLEKEHKLKQLLIPKQDDRYVTADEVRELFFSIEGASSGRFLPKN